MNLYELASRNTALAHKRHQKIGPRRLAPIRNQSTAIKQHELQRILVLIAGNSRFALFATPALRALRNNFPSAHISVLGGIAAEDILHENPHIDLLRTVPALASHPEKASARQLAQWPQGLRQEQYDAALIMAPSSWHAALLAARARIPIRLGMDRYKAGRFLTHSMPYDPNLHAVAHNLRLIETLLGTAPVVSTHLHFAPDEAQVALAQRSMLSSLTSTHPLIAILAGDGTQPSHWRPEGWATVADQLMLQHNAQIVLVDTAKSAIAKAMRFTPHMIIGRHIDTAALAALFARCDLVLGFHSDAMHLAVALERPAVLLYGPHDPAYVGPWGDEARYRVVRSSMTCAPCNLSEWPADTLENHPCVRQLKSYAVLNAALELLETAPPSTVQP